MNILDYIKWRGDLTFDKDPFNYVDNLILCELIYISLEDFIKDKRYTINELYNEYIDFYGEDSFIDDIPWHRKILLKELAFSNRFKDIILYNYINKKDYETAEQFRAATYDLNDNTSYIVFEGTDASILGWKENFMTTFTTTAGQLDALRYLNNYKGNNKLRVGGHSKGGYLATFAALNANKDIQDKIIKIISNDGPGLNADVINLDNFHLIKDKYIQIVPEDDVVGMAFDIGGERLIIKSSKNNFYSHNSYTWLVERNEFVKGELTEKALIIKKQFEQFILDTTIQERERLTSSIFNIMEKNNINTIKEIETNNLLAYFKAIKELAELDNDNKEVATKFLKVFTHYYEDKLTSFIGKLDFRKKE